jgi:hypothetical protein
MHMNRAIILLSVLLILAGTLVLAADVQAMSPASTGAAPRLGPSGPSHGALEDLQPAIDPARVMGLLAAAVAALGMALVLWRRQPAHE